MAQIIPKRVLEDIRVRSDIVDVVGSYVHLQRAGSAFKTLCPFHKEKTPSFHVNPQRQIFHCFGCGAGGDVFGFVMQQEGVDFIGAVRLLAKRAGVALEMEEGAAGGPRKEQLYAIHEDLARFYQRCLLQMPSSAVARRYLESRDLTAKLVEEFLIGYAPDRWDTVLKWGEKNRHPVELLETCGLVLRSSRPDGGSGRYDRFRNRIMFPIRDEQGRVIAFSGRALEADAKTAKYVNSPETPLFHKGRVLYALDRARRHIVESREALLCEGQIDVIRCHAAGVTTAVASQGTAFTEDHARIVRRYADGVAILFDPDRAGEDAAIRTAGLFLEAGLAVRVASLPRGEDPDAFIRAHGAEQFREALAAAESAVRFQVRVLSSRDNVRSEVGAMRAAKAVLQTIGRSPNAVQRAKLVQEAAGMLGLPASALQDDLRHMLRQAGRSRAAQPAEEQAQGGGDAPEAQPPPREEVELCEHVVHAADFPGIAPLVERYLPARMISHPLCRAVVEAALAALRGGADLHELLREGKGASQHVQRFAAAV
jgi:DNA primase